MRKILGDEIISSPTIFLKIIKLFGDEIFVTRTFDDRDYATNVVSFA